LSISLSSHFKKNAKEQSDNSSWDDDSESDSREDVDVANICFMAHGDDPTKAPFKPNLDDSDLTMDEPANFFEELQERYDLLKVQYRKLKKENDVLINNINEISKEKDVLSISPKNVQKDFDNYKIARKAKFSSVDKNEFSNIKIRIDALSNTLKKYDVDKATLGSMFLKK